MLFSEYYPNYFTATILEWKHQLKQDKYKDLVVSGLKFLVNENRIKVYGFCLMSSHIHLIFVLPGVCHEWEEWIILFNVSAFAGVLHLQLEFGYLLI